LLPCALEHLLAVGVVTGIERTHIAAIGIMTVKRLFPIRSYPDHASLRIEGWRMRSPAR
jgi:hypothetical protein